MTEEDNRLITEKLGLCWHVTTVHHEDGRIFLTCSCGAEGWPEPCPNYDFSHRDSFWIVLEEGQKQEWWWEFVDWSTAFTLYKTKRGYDQVFNWAIKQDFIGPRLAEELLRWIKEEGENASI